MSANNFEKQVGEVVQRRLRIDDEANQNELEEELIPIKEEILGLLEHPDGENVVYEAMVKVAGENDLLVKDVAILLFPEKINFFNSPIQESDFNEGNLFERIKFLYSWERDLMQTLDYLDVFKDRPYAAEVLENATKIGGSRKVLQLAEIYADQPYAEEIITNAAKWHPDYVLKWADKYIDQPYAEEIITNVAKEYPDYALKWADKYIDQPYAAQVIIEATQKNLAYALECADKYADQPYAEEIITNAAEEEPTLTLKYADRYSDRPYAATVIEKAAETNPLHAVMFASEYADQPYAATIIEKAVRKVAETDPAAALTCTDQYKDYPYAREVIEKAAKLAAKENPAEALRNIEVYKNEPYAEEVITNAAKDDPKALVYLLLTYDSLPYIALLIEKAARELVDKGSPYPILSNVNYFKEKAYGQKLIDDVMKNSPVQIFLNLKHLKDLVKNSNDEEVKKIYGLMQTLDRVDYPMLALSDPIINGPLTMEEARKILKNPAEMMKKLMEIKNKPNVIGRFDIETALSDASLRFVQDINELHESADSKRFASIQDFSAEQLYYLMVYGEEEIFTSSFKGIFDRMISNMEKAGQSGYDLLRKVGRSKFRTMIKLCSNYARLDEFLGTMQEHEKMEVIESFVSNLEKSEDSLAEAVTVADTFAALKDRDLLAKIQEILKLEFERAQGDGNSKGMKLYGLLAGMFGERAEIDKEWYTSMAKKYQLSNVLSVATESLFNKDGSNVQQHFFYNDEDGIASFNHFMTTYRSDESWQIEDKKTFVVLRKSEGSKRIVMYANKPHEDVEGIEAIEKVLQEKKVEKIVVVHRGHSYHAANTIAKITPSASIVFLGSCGGYNNMSEVLEKSSNAHILATKGTGTMLVNDQILKMINGEILHGKDVDWQQFWTKAEKYLGDNQDFLSYIPPNKNLGVLFLKAYKNTRV